MNRDSDNERLRRLLREYYRARSRLKRSVHPTEDSNERHKALTDAAAALSECIARLDGVVGSDAIPLEATGLIAQALGLLGDARVDIDDTVRKYERRRRERQLTLAVIERFLESLDPGERYLISERYGRDSSWRSISQRLGRTTAALRARDRVLLGRLNNEIERMVSRA